MRWLSRLAPAAGFEFPARTVIAIVCAAVGVLIAVSGALTFRRAGTTVNPMKPDKATSLVTSGVFAHTRNPMYLGLLIGLTGWSIYLSNAVAFLFLPAFVAYINRFQIAPEEKVLASLFGKEFADYKSRVRRWL
ncbi:MAG: isoprenylcysteine carboxylmethyltransferase family protein [Bryobacterales bacterium]|nr:isoprenylcysteine carboxylmethyltransferase family protein [Bryobacterales bacterium]